MNSTLSSLVRGLISALTSSSSARPRRQASGPQPSPVRQAAAQEFSPGRRSGSQTLRIDPEGIVDLQVSYAPRRDGDPDAGEVIWTWVPYEEGDGRGKDRPVLVIGRESADRVYAVRMTSKPHDGDRDFLSIGSGSWDPRGRESWVDIEQLYSVHVQGMRRETAGLDRDRYDRVAQALISRYGWARG